ncbi:LuxR C-terminal-related transcriptional regulator [Geodermatophilus sp. SYSU D00703]
MALLPSWFTPPPVRAGIVPRTGLLRRLLQAEEQVIALVAPPGYGKTTLLAQWAARDRRPFAWLRLDRRCNDPVVLLCSLALALAQVIPVDRAVFARLMTAHRLQREAVVAELAATVSRAPRPFVLAIDDIHLLTDAEGAEALQIVLGHLSTGARLAAAGRAEPPLGLPRLRGEGRVVDLGAADLRLDAAGARELLSAAGAQLDDEQVVQLLARTEGWPIGLYFAALAGHGAGPTVPVDAFSGEDRLLADYIRSEFLAQLPADRLRFLTRTAVLDELCGPLCDAVLQRTGSAAELEQVETSNLLLVPLDRQRRWYRYHALFQAVLRRELERTDPEAVPALARRAARWCERNGLFDAAVHYAQLAADVDGVGRLVLRDGLRQYAAGRVAALGEWFTWLIEHGSADGGVAVLGTWLAMLSGRPAEAERWAAVADAGDPAAEQPDGSPLEGWLSTMRAAMARDDEHMREQAARALQLLAPASHFRPTAALCLGLAELLGGDAAAADQQLVDTAELGEHLRAEGAAALAMSVRALIALRADRWPDADALVQRAWALIERAGQQSYPLTAMNHALRARIAAHAADPAGAHREITAAARLLPQLSRALGHVAVLTRLELTRAAVAVGDPAAAAAFLAEAQQLFAGGLRFGSLQQDAQDLVAAIEQQRSAAPGLPRLTPAELRLLPLLATQRSLPEIAEQQYLSVHTIKAQVTSIYRKLGTSSRTQAVDRAHGLGLLPTSSQPGKPPPPRPAPDRRLGDRGESSPPADGQQPAATRAGS